MKIFDAFLVSVECFKFFNIDRIEEKLKLYLFGLYLLSALHVIEAKGVILNGHIAFFSLVSSAGSAGVHACAIKQNLQTVG